MKKVLVTGATGFIGSNMVKRLCQDDIDVFAIVRPKSLNLNRIAGYNVKIIECDLNNMEKLYEKIKGKNIDTIFHFGWQGVYGVSLQDEVVQLKNVSDTLRLVDIAHTAGIHTFIGAGSIHETEAIVEMNKDKIVSNLGLMYKSAKLAAHYTAKAKCGNYGMKFFWPIITNTYGPGENSERLICSIIRNLLAGKTMELSQGNQLYDFIYIDDLVEAFYLIGKYGIDGNNYILGSGQPKPLKEWLLDLEKIVNEYVSNSYIKLAFGKKQGDVTYLCKQAFDISNIEKDMEFKAQTSFEEGIRMTVQYMCEWR